MGWKEQRDLLVTQPQTIPAITSSDMHMLGKILSASESHFARL